MSRLFGARPVGAVTLVEAPVSQAYARRAKVAFAGVSAVSGLSVAAGVAFYAHPLLAVVLGIVAGLVCGFTAAVLIWAWPVLRVLWWWSLEITLLATAVLVPSWLVRTTGNGWLVLAGALLAVGVCGLVGPVRRTLVAWSWCVAVRHRLRLFLAEFVRSGGRVRAGCLPLVLWSRPTRAGERVWLWLRPGLELADLEGKTGKLAVACWANEVRVVRASMRFAALIRVDVGRRDPLAHVVASPLAALVPTMRTSDAPLVSDVPVVGLDLDEVAEPVPATPTRGGRR